MNHIPNQCTNIKLSKQYNCEPIFKVVSILFGYDSKENENLLELNNNNTILTIRKKFYNKFSETKVVNEWKFFSSVFYTVPDFDTIFINEIEKSKVYFNFTKNYKGSMLIVSQNKDTFLNTSSPVFHFLIKCMNSLFSECFGDNFGVYISYYHVKNFSQYMEIFDFDIPFSKKKFKGMNLMQDVWNDDIEIKDLCEISMHSIENFVEIMELLEKNLKDNLKNNSLSLKIPNDSHFRQLLGFENISNKFFNNLNSSCLSLKKKPNNDFNPFVHEVVTIRVFDKYKNFFSKYNFVLYKAYELGSIESISNSKENSLFFNAVIRNNFRDSKFTRLLQKTCEYNTFILNLLPCSENQHLIILHDILNLIKSRKSFISLDSDFQIEKDFNNLKISRKKKEKENKKESVIQEKYLETSIVDNIESEINNKNMGKEKIDLLSEYYKDFQNFKEQETINQIKTKSLVKESEKRAIINDNETEHKQIKDNESHINSESVYDEDFQAMLNLHKEMKKKEEETTIVGDVSVIKRLNFDSSLVNTFQSINSLSKEKRDNRENDFNSNNLKSIKSKKNEELKEVTINSKFSSRKKEERNPSNIINITKNQVQNNFFLAFPNEMKNNSLSKEKENE